MQKAKADFYARAFQRYQKAGRGTLQDIDTAWSQATGSLWDMPAMLAWQKRYPQAVGQADIPK